MRMIRSGQSCIPPSMIPPALHRQSREGGNPSGLWIPAFTGMTQGDSGDERKPRLGRDGETHRADAFQSLDSRGELCIEPEVAAQNQLGFAAVQPYPEMQLAMATPLCRHHLGQAP